MYGNAIKLSKKADKKNRDFHKEKSPVVVIFDSEKTYNSYEFTKHFPDKQKGQKIFEKKSFLL